MALELHPGELAIYALEIVVLIGIAWKFQFGPGAADLRDSRLSPWLIPWDRFLLLGVEIIFGALLGALAIRGICSALPKALQPSLAFSEIVISSGLHLGAVAAMARASFSGVTASSKDPADQPVRPPVSTGRAVLLGLLTFVVAIPLLTAVALVWQGALDVFGIPAEKQELLDVFSQTHDPAKLGFMIVVAVVIAPVTEELIFRAGIFRYLRTRLPRWLAYVIPAALFALLHANLAVFFPLFALALLFSIAYQRTGRIVTTMVAHALFNLNTIILVLAGINT